MAWFYTVLGAVLIAAGLVDVFQTLLHPGGRGKLSRLVTRAVWAAGRIAGGPVRSIVGPLAIGAVVTMWVVLEVLGWALICLPYVPDGFSYSPGLEPTAYPDAAEALYISLVTISTLGFGDVVATDGGLRLLLPLESLTGFALLTAAVSWFLQIYPALARRHVLAIRLAMLERTEYARILDSADDTSSSRMLEILARDFIQLRVDLMQNPETYYFHEPAAEILLPAPLVHAYELGRRARQSRRHDLRLAGELLTAALDDLAFFLRSEFGGPGESPVEIFRSLGVSRGED
ncbi:ion channel [Arthrobacter sp. I2-34]|uniref:Ion channel n=1 Tax=Arthrobacter hankyongi TaxID=2904801 RepID=A0ABS9L848_9MICC|nr:ion channel [Arthrobacter hankyongi]MCG2622853.1 ion channel [Arthrobacter hankyongi]